MSDIVREQAPLSRSDSVIREWADDLELAYLAAQKLVRTSFVPQAFKDKPAEAAAAIMTGAEVGLTPMASLRSIDVINGTPAFKAIAMRALALSHGHSMWVEESTATRCIVRGQRVDSEHVETSIWTTDRARGLNLLGRPNWKAQPIAMLVARATSECARLIAADVLLGLPYSSEEISDGLEEVGVPTPVKRQSRTVQRKALPITVPEPELPADDPTNPPEPAETPMALDTPEPDLDKNDADYEWPPENDEPF